MFNLYDFFHGKSQQVTCPSRVTPLDAVVGSINFHDVCCFGVLDT